LGRITACKARTAERKVAIGEDQGIERGHLLDTYFSKGLGWGGSASNIVQAIASAWLVAK